MPRHIQLSTTGVLMVSMALAWGACHDAVSTPGGGSGSPSGDADPKPAVSAPDQLGHKKLTTPVPPELAPSPSPRLNSDVKAEELDQKVASYFAGHVGRRIYLQVDKPLYQPGESIWVRAWDVQARDLSSAESGTIQLQLVSPRGSVVETKLLRLEEGVATNDFELPEEIAGGEYTLRANSYDGAPQAERTVIINTYEAPRLKKTLEFIRKSYGEGDEVTATVEVKRPTGEPLATKALTADIRLDGEDLPPVHLTTDAQGNGLVRFTLPDTIAAGDGLLTVLVEDGGITESVSKRIPIVLKKLQVAFFPEGGELVQGVPSRVYFAAKTPLGKPADVEGRVVDDLGNAIAAFRSYRDGLGRVSFTPATGRSYHAEITKPVGVTEQYALPIANEQGCVLRTFDDLDGQLPALRASVTCSETKNVIVTAVMRENVLDTAVVRAEAGEPAIVSLQPKDEALARAQGIARVTVFDSELNPLAERLVYRNRRNRLQVTVTPDKPQYSPRDPVALNVSTKDLDGRPVPASVALSVVDDTVISYADDKTGHLLSRLFLEPELADKVEEPNFYFDLTEEKSALAMDLLMGTRGYRKFEWQQVFNPPPPVNFTTRAYLEDDLALAPRAGMAAQAAPMNMAPPPEAPAPAERMRMAGPADKTVAHFGPAPAKDLAIRQRIAGNIFEQKPIQFGHRLAKEKADKMNRRQAQAMAGFAPVRVFPVPEYTSDFSGPRTDFRETIFWAPSVKTDSEGHATVRFVTSDAVTSFRVFTEAVGHGLAGRDEAVFKSSLPFSLSVKLPMEVSSGDKPLVPVTLSNERDRTLDVSLAADFGTLVKAGEAGNGGALAAGARKSLFFPLEITGTQGQSQVSIRASTGGLNDEFTRTLNVVPLGFPQLISRSGQVSDRVRHEIDLGSALPGTITATVKLYPSPLATIVSGMEGLLREPSGCFEQTSSSNYPNVMVMQYLKQQNIADPAILSRSEHLLDSGYHRLVGFETPQEGYEWFGSAPAHEALSAYGLLEFMDMKGVYEGVDDKMIARTASWLEGRRDGKGGYLRDGKALDTFGRASAPVTNAYITYSLVLAGETGLEKEIAAQASLARETRDPYLLALAASTLLHVPERHRAGLEAASTLAGMQDEGGSWKGAKESITKSGGVNLEIETTSLALLALIEAGSHPDATRRGISWLMDHRGGFGAWGATQATVLALKAMTAYANASRATHEAGAVTLRINGEDVGTLHYESGHREPLVFADLTSQFHAGKNTLELVHDGEAMPYSFAVEYRSVKPATSPEAVVDLATALERTTVKMGEPVRLNATITNKTQQGQPMTLARIGLPGGLSFQTWQLKELREKGLIAFYETRPREVILYFRDLKPAEVKKIPIDLVATVPGSYTGPSSSAYLYYNDEHKTWVDAVSVRIDP